MRAAAKYTPAQQFHSAGIFIAARESPFRRTVRHIQNPAESPSLIISTLNSGVPNTEGQN